MLINNGDVPKSTATKETAHDILYQGYLYQNPKGTAKEAEEFASSMLETVVGKDYGSVIGNAFKEDTTNVLTYLSEHSADISPPIPAVPKEGDVEILADILMENGYYTDKELARIAAEKSLATTGSIQKSREEFKIPDPIPEQPQTATEAVAEAYQEANVTVDPTTGQDVSDVVPVIDAAAATIASVDASENYDTPKEAMESLDIPEEKVEQLSEDYPLSLGTPKEENLPSIDFEDPEIGEILSLSDESIYELNEELDYIVLSSSADGFSSDDIENLISDLNNLDTSLGELAQTAQSISSEFSSLNDVTEKIASGYNIDGDSLQSSAKDSISKWQEAKDDLSTKLNSILEEIVEADEVPYNPHPKISTTPKKESPDYSHPTGITFSKDVFNPNEITTSPQKEIINNVMSLGGLGTISFMAIVPMFSNLGSSPVMYTDLNTNYDVIGINTFEGKYYYKIYDKKTDEIYYAEFDENAKLDAKYKEVLKSNEVSMMLNKPEIGEDVLTKMTDSNELYFTLDTVSGEGELEGIKFANVFDSTDGQKYYIPLSNSTEVLSIDKITNTQSVETSSSSIV